jgi:hypothetical protein
MRQKMECESGLIKIYALPFFSLSLSHTAQFPACLGKNFYVRPKFSLDHSRKSKINVLSDEKNSINTFADAAKLERLRAFFTES